MMQSNVFNDDDEYELANGFFQGLLITGFILFIILLLYFIMRAIYMGFS